MNIVEATKAYDAWMAARISVVRRDLAIKHKQMAAAPFPFLRATFYRWVQVWREACADLAETPSVLAVGDLHVENFGTWRDGESRLVWGINDFDEAARLPYAIDLVRLATSAILARSADGLSISADEACTALLRGYADALAKGGKAFVLEESHPMLRQLALGAERDPTRFWSKMQRLPTVRPVPRKVRALLRARLPDPNATFRVAHRVAGLGSLGRPRYVALAEWNDGLVAREAKALMPSAARWARGKSKDKILYSEIVARSVRCPDPHVSAERGWLLRRLAPHCSRIELADIPKERDERHFLECMGRETANVHLGTPEAVGAIRSDLRRRNRGWLLAAAETMAAATLHDFKVWRARR